MTGKGICNNSSQFFRFMVWLLICALFLPAPVVMTARADDATGNAHVLRRLNSPERQAAIAEAARQDAAGHEAQAQNEVAVPAVPVAPVSRNAAVAAYPASPSKDTSAVARPQSVTEVLFNYAAGFAGVPGLAPRQGVDGSLDEGLGFHQDGTARKAGGVAGSSGPSDRGQRARAYMQSGMQSGYGQSLGMSGYGAGFGYSDPNDPLGSNWWRGDSTRGGRVSGSGGYSRDLGDFDPMNMAIDRGLNYGAGFVNSMGEAALSGLVDGGRARLNFRLDRDGYFSGEGDALLPFYDSAKTTIYTQLGARSMHDSSDTRWIGNFGIGQRWFPLAQGDDLKAADYDAGQLMLGYNAFFDYDFTRDHQRGGIGAEMWYDWLRLSSNYYFPLSDWKGSEDFDSRFVKERPAEGWDARVKAYLPFYRHIAVTGAYSQWFGDHVGMFGASRLEKDPKVWSYGLEYTPVPLVSGFITQKSTERGRTATEFGLNFTYHFQMPWEDQITPAKVAELRTVGGSRHEFVDRENRIILEYKAKNAYHIEYLGPNGSSVNEFVFRIRNGFDEFVAGQTVRVTASGVTLAAAPAPEKSFLARAGDAVLDFFSVSAAYAADFSQTYTTDGQGRFIVRVSSGFAGPVTLSIQAGNNTQDFTVNVVANEKWELNASSATLTQGVSGSLTLTLTRGGVAQSGVSVSFAANPNITGLPSGSVTTDSNGHLTLTNLVVLVSTNQTITATVDGTNLSVPVTVIPGTYSLEASPSTLAQHVPADVTFTVKQGGQAVPAGASVSFVANSNFTNLPTTVTTDASGQITVANLTATASGSQTISVTVDGQTVSVGITVSDSVFALSFPAAATGGGDFAASTTARFTAKLTRNNVAYATPTEVTWSIVSANNSGNVAVVSSYQNRTTGLAWGSSATSSPGSDLATTATSNTNASGEATIQLTDIMGERTVTVRASVTIGGQPYTADQPVTFGKGPLSAFRLPSGGEVGQAQWAKWTPISAATSLPAAAMCGANVSSTTFQGWTSGDYSSQTNLPTITELRTVASVSGNAAWQAAGWPYDNYWLGELLSTSLARIVLVGVGDSDYRGLLDDTNRVVCRR